MKLGYHVVDATGLDLDSLGKVEGIKAKLDKALAIGKPVFLENVVDGNEAIIPIPVALLKASTTVSIYAPTGDLSVSASDVVSQLS